LYRYHAGGNLVLAAGIVAGIVTHGFGLLPAWAGFMIGSIPTLLMSALAHTIHDA